MITFSKAPVPESALQYITEALRSRLISGDNIFTKKCQQWIESQMNCPRALLTTSGTHTLELAALLLEIVPGDEVIMPSFTFSSTANAFVLRGARIKFIDVRPDTMNMNETLIEQAITSRTRAIVPVHYAGIACEMDTIMQIAKAYNLAVIEDAAQGILSRYNDRYLGTIGHLGAYSFHETKNITCGEGGALLLNDNKYLFRAEILREKGTNRAQFFRGEIDKYSWIDIGSSYLMSDFNAAFLLAQFEIAQQITSHRLSLWNYYYDKLLSLRDDGHIELPSLPANAQKHNAHIFFLKVKNLEMRSRLLKYLKNMGIYATSHYIPLHSSMMGQKVGEFIGEDIYTTRGSEQLIRLPLYYEMTINEDTANVVDAIYSFFKNPTQRKDILPCQL